MDLTSKNQKSETSPPHPTYFSKDNDQLTPSISTSALHGLETKSQMPTSQSYIATTTTTTKADTSATPNTPISPASIKSNPPLISPSTFLSSSPDQSLSKIKNGVSIRSNLNFHLSNNSNGSNALILNVKNTLNKTNDYTRSPHGIYTRVNVPPTNVNNNNNSSTTSNATNGNSLVFSQRSPTTFRLIRSPVTTLTPSQLPQSSSTVMISSGGFTNSINTNGVMSNPTSPIINGSHNVSNNNSRNNFIGSNIVPSTKRTSSLRSIQKPQQPVFNKYNQSDLINGSSNGAVSVSASSFIQANTPTKQQLQNHSLRVASIQQKQQTTTNNAANYYSNVSVIPQKPRPNQERITQLNQQINSLEISSSTSNHKLVMPNQIKTAAKLVKKSVTGPDIIEQYDYI